MKAADYEAWYHTPRGAWIGERELFLVIAALSPGQGDTLLDIGAGTGWFTRNVVARTGVRAVALDIDRDGLAFARERAADDTCYLQADGSTLPLRDASVDHAMAITSLCFIDDDRRAVAEMLRVTRNRFALGLLNRHSLLWWRKGRRGGTGAYRGARWHTPREALALFDGLPVADLRVQSAIHLPGGGPAARWLESKAPASWLTGAFLLLSGSVSDPTDYQAMP
ncbi:MAG: class I SAM-dependent methyltransferase [Wenzhouxiangella sp.]